MHAVFSLLRLCQEESCLQKHWYRRLWLSLYSHLQILWPWPVVYSAWYMLKLQYGFIHVPDELRSLQQSWFSQQAWRSRPTFLLQSSSWVNNVVREVAHARKRNPLFNLDKILQCGRYPWYNHLLKFWWRSVKGFRGGGVKCCPPHRLSSSSLTLSHYCASVWFRQVLHCWSS